MTPAPASGARVGGFDDWSRVCIVGVGLIGESLARALKLARPGLLVTGVDDAQVVRDAQSRGVLDEGISSDARQEVASQFAACNLVVLAAPVGAIQSWLPMALDHAPLVTDCGSTKRAILAASRNHPRATRFVPGHPMAGAGGGGARSNLFHGLPWVICGEGSDEDAVVSVEECTRRLGARTVRLSAEAHDAAVAVTSHVPRLVASALTVLAEEEGAFEAAGPAFERLSRGAGGSRGVWSDVFGSNGDEVTRVLRHLLHTLGGLVADLEAGASRSSVAIIERAERSRRAFTER